MIKFFLYIFILTTSLQASPVENYFDKVSELTNSESWREMIALGEAALKSKEANDTRRALIHSQLASYYYYLGEYEDVERHAISCQALSRSLQNPDLLIQSLYSLSGTKRALANQEPHFGQMSKYYNEAKNWIQKALDLLPSSKNPFLCAKVFFNAGAVYADSPQGDLKKAHQYYLDAMRLFQKQGNNDNYNRTIIRLAKVCILQNNFKNAEKLLKKIESSIERERTWVNFLHMKALLLQKKGKRKEAKQTIEKALALAQKLEMKVNCEKLYILLNTLDTH